MSHKKTLNIKKKKKKRSIQKPHLVLFEKKTPFPTPSTIRNAMYTQSCLLKPLVN